MYNKNNQQQQPAVVVETVVHGDTSFNLTEKAAVSIRKLNGKYIASLPPEAVKILADLGCEPLQTLLASEAYGKISQNKQDSKLIRKLQQDEAKALEFARQAQAMLEAIAETKAKLKVG